MSAPDLATIRGEELSLNLRLLYGRLRQDKSLADELNRLFEAVALKEVTESEFRRGVVDALDLHSSPPSVSS